MDYFFILFSQINTDERVSKEAKDFAKTHRNAVKPVIRAKIKAEKEKKEVEREKNVLVKENIELKNNLVSINSG